MTIVLNTNQDQVQIFETVQGEGLFSGVPSFFVRLQGCNVRCFFCDEKPTWKHGEGPSFNAEKLISEFELLNTDLKRLVITGGEPTEQDLIPVIEVLLGKAYSVAIETAASGEFMSKIIDFKLNLEDPSKLWLTFSPKEIYSENGQLADHRIWSEADEIKFVIANDDAIKYLNEVILVNSPEDQTIFVVPDWHQKEQIQPKIIEELRANSSRLRLGIQAHKFWGLA